MHQRRGLQGLPCAQTGACSLRDASELLVEGRKQLGSDTTYFGRRRAGSQPGQRVRRQRVFIGVHGLILANLMSNAAEIADLRLYVGLQKGDHGLIALLNDHHGAVGVGASRRSEDRALQLLCCCAPVGRGNADRSAPSGVRATSPGQMPGSTPRPTRASGGSFWAWTDREPRHPQARHGRRSPAPRPDWHRPYFPIRNCCSSGCLRPAPIRIAYRTPSCRWPAQTLPTLQNQNPPLIPPREGEYRRSGGVARRFWFLLVNRRSLDPRAPSEPVSVYDMRIIR